MEYYAILLGKDYMARSRATYSYNVTGIKEFDNDLYSGMSLE